jgi:hypothetical protein
MLARSSQLVGWPGNLPGPPGLLSFPRAALTAAPVAGDRPLLHRCDDAAGQEAATRPSGFGN